jgi:GNAT superfamily N-acetyltransferase
MTDVLGTCVSWGDGILAVRREDGVVVELATADVVAGKPVPPRPSVRHRVDPVDADRQLVAGWPPVESEPLGEWLLRASGGFSSRGNSVLALGDPGLGPEEAVRRVAGWYAARGLVPRAHVHPGGEPEAAFAAAGWERYESTRLMLASVAQVVRRTTATTAVSLDDRVSPGWLATDERATRYGEAALAVLEQGEVTFATVTDDDGSVVARGRGAAHGDWVGLASLWTREDRRGSGLGTAVLRALAEWGAERGARTAYLQVVVANERAAELYARHGFAEHHRYDYLRAGTTGGTPGPPAPSSAAR